MHAYLSVFFSINVKVFLFFLIWHVLVCLFDFGTWAFAECETFWHEGCVSLPLSFILSVRYCVVLLLSLLWTLLCEASVKVAVCWPCSMSLVPSRQAASPQNHHPQTFLTWFPSPLWRHWFHYRQATELPLPQRSQLTHVSPRLARQRDELPLPTQTDRSHSILIMIILIHISVMSSIINENHFLFGDAKHFLRWGYNSLTHW